MAHQTPDFYEPTGIIIVSKHTAVSVGDYVSGHGIQPGTRVIDVKVRDYTYDDGGESQLKVTLNKKPWTGNTPPTGITESGAKGDDWYLTVTFSNFKIDGVYSESKDTTLSFREDVKGWVSFKSFIPENGISVANEYYTFINGKLFKHHIENIDRNTFYKGEVVLPFIESSINVILNDVPGTVKSFVTLNYEGSQSKVNVNIQDDQYFNLETKEGWYVESIETDKEKGSLNEFIEKEGKWFNYLKGQSIETTDKNNLIINEDGSSSFDQASFAIQGIGTAISGTINCIYGCTDESNYYYNPLANCDDGSCAPTPSWDCNNGNCIDPGDGKGYYKSLTACENLCTAALQSWDCVQMDPRFPGTCIDPGTGNGAFGSLSACQNSCGGFASWTCGTGQTGCVDGGLNGPYQTLAECEATPCPPLTWDCVAIGNPGNTTNTCIQPNTPGTGAYTSLTECQAGCANTPSSPPCPSGNFQVTNIVNATQAGFPEFAINATDNNISCDNGSATMVTSDIDFVGGAPSYHFLIIPDDDLIGTSGYMTSSFNHNTSGYTMGAFGPSQPYHICNPNGAGYSGPCTGSYTAYVVFENGCTPVGGPNDNGETISFLGQDGMGLNAHPPFQIDSWMKQQFTVGCDASSTVSWDCDSSGGTCHDPGTGNGQFSTFADCEAVCGSPSGCVNTMYDGAAVGPMPATNNPCDNGTHAYQSFTNSSYWTITYYTATTPGQVTGGTLFYEDLTQYSSGQLSNTLTLPQGEYYFIAADANGCPQTGIIGTGNSFTIGCVKSTTTENGTY